MKQKDPMNIKATAIERQICLNCTMPVCQPQSDSCPLQVIGLTTDFGSRVNADQFVAIVDELLDYYGAAGSDDAAIAKLLIQDAEARIDIERRMKKEARHVA